MSKRPHSKRKGKKKKTAIEELWMALYSCWRWAISYLKQMLARGAVTKSTPC